MSSSHGFASRYFHVYFFRRTHAELVVVVVVVVVVIGGRIVLPFLSFIFATTIPQSDG